MEYEKLDAWKACDALVKAVFHATKEIESRDPELLGHICRNSLRAAVKLAYGCGTQNRKMLVMSVQRTAGYLSAFAYNISLARVMGVLPEDVCMPGFSPPTSSFFINLGLGLVVFVAYHYFGVREHGPKYFKQFMGPMVFLAPLFILIEVFSHAFRPISLSIRLYGNMFGDHLVLEIFSDLTKVVIPVLFYILGALVSVIQASVFTILTIIYVAMAISHEH